jgi:hypothetical protein
MCAASPQRVVVLPLVLVAGLVDVGGSAICPAPARVAEALAPLLPATSAAARPHRAELTTEGAIVLVKLHAPDGAPMRDRALPAEGTCDDLARAAAVVIAAWAGTDLGFSVSAPRAAEIRTKTEKRKSVPRFEIAPGFVGSLAGADFAAGAGVEVMIAPPRVNAAGRIALHGTDTREQALATGGARWTRVALSLGPLWRLRPGRFLVDLHADLLLALLAIEGQRFDTTGQSFGFDPGLGAGVRAGVKAGPAAPFIGLRIAGWLRRQEATVTGATGGVDIPRFEVLLTAGVGFGSFF